jgi:long-subunit fatty acid transport protein
VQLLSHRLPRTISLATVILFLLTLVSSACAAGLLLYETGAPDLGTASAGRAAMATNASTAAANPAGMTLLDRTQLMVTTGALLPMTNFSVGPQTTTKGGGDNAGVLLPRRASFLPIGFPIGCGSASVQIRISVCLRTMAAGGLGATTSIGSPRSR